MMRRAAGMRVTHPRAPHAAQRSLKPSAAAEQTQTPQPDLGIGKFPGQDR